MRCRPLPEQEVARQFEKNTTLGPVRTTVKDVRYAPKEDAYKISFSYVITGGPTASPTEWTAPVTLSSYGLGRVSWCDPKLRSSTYGCSVGWAIPQSSSPFPWKRLRHLTRNSFVCCGI